MTSKKHPAYHLEEPALTRTEAAALLGISPEQLDALRLPKRKVGKRTLYSLKTLEPRLTEAFKRLLPYQTEASAVAALGLLLGGL